MVIPAIDEGDANGCSLQRLGGSEASEAAPDDDDMWSLHDVAEGGGPDS